MAGALPAAYGFRFEGAPRTPWLAVEGAENWPSVTLELNGVREPEFDLDGLTARFPADVEHGELVHPWIARAAVVIAIERGFEVMHAGALVAGDGAWALVGPKEAGKSTLLAACATAGMTVLTDDTLAMDGDRCLAGPRCLDLREEAAEHYGATVQVRPETPRRRLTLPPTAGEVRLAGLIHLAWGDGPALEKLSPGDAVRRLLRGREATGAPRDPVRLVDLAGLPTYELRRPRDWRALAATADLLRSELGSSSPV